MSIETARSNNRPLLCMKTCIKLSLIPPVEISEQIFPFPISHPVNFPFSYDEVCFIVILCGHCVHSIVTYIFFRS